MEVFSDFICPWCYIGHRRLTVACRALGEEPGLDVQWRPFELNPGMPAAGVDRREYRTAKFGSWERSQELDAGTVEAGVSDGVEFRYDLMGRTPNTLAAHRLVWAARDTGRPGELVDLLFRAYFTEGRDISDRAVLGDVALGAGLPGGVARRAWGSEEAKAGVREQEERASALGVSGVPYHIIDGRHSFSGAAPTDDLVRVLRRVSEQRRERA